jgi:hypothetical protein
MSMRIENPTFLAEAANTASASPYRHTLDVERRPVTATALAGRCAS